jgi:putative sterol carrier protein
LGLECEFFKLGLQKKLSMTLTEYFENLASKLSPEQLDGVDTVINFDLKGSGKSLTVKDGKVSHTDSLGENAEITLTATEEDLLNIISGDSNPMMAMMMGKLKVSNPGAMMKYAKLLGLM